MPPISGEVTFLLPTDAQAWLSWSASAAATPLTPLAAVPYPSPTPAGAGSNASSPWPSWPADGASSSDLGAISTKLSLVGGRSYWLLLNCSAATTSAQGCALGARLHAAAAPHALSLSGRTLAGRTEVTLNPNPNPNRNRNPNPNPNAPSPAAPR